MSEPNATAHEQRALKYSVWGNLSLGVLGIVFAALCHSDAVLLDGVFSLINFGVALLSLKVARMVMRPTDDRYPFGYAYYEPILNLGKGLIIATVCLLGLYSSAGALFHGGREIAAGIAFFYAISASGIGLFITLTLRAFAKKCHSPIVDVDAKNWLLDTVLSGIIAVALLGVYLLENSRFRDWAPYADPVAVMVLCLIFMPVPIRIIRENWAQVLGQNVDAKLLKDAREAMANYLADKSCESHQVRAIRAGRFVYLHVFLIVAKDATWPSSVEEQDACRRAICEQLKPTYPYLVIDVMFTHDKVWADQDLLS
ncbi:cation diffusion facilitator family transporter [Cerasicoccus arenae]|uniref:Cation efflux protein transmembrane domain-containing protein n=1 Tax=Cerasicoccus arenae TaxID=424488 RepID=A0A8J3DAR7_9BACT|nr:cation diffusion facilitator family transporter [Cerasicoccus arenae]MBK1858887.1 cation diffusion facilitator family transporter [Cerasicoccus arenae]GHB96274.1 hypothetical protein GCM10007047_10070 [Cerasicoccus arenae]